MQTPLTKILIVGGGAGGLELATRLGQTLGKQQQASITLVDASLTHLWKPLWHEVAAGTLLSHEDEVNYILQAYQNYFNFELGRLAGLNRKQKQIALAPIVDDNNSETIPSRTLNYDILVIAIGSISNDFGTPGVAQYCTFLDDRVSAEIFQQKLLKKILRSQYQLREQGATELTIAIVGGGATGVELAAELQDAIQQAARYNRTPINSHYKIQIAIIEAADRLLAASPEKLARKTRQQLEKMGIEVHTGQRVAEINEKGLLTHTGLFIPADLKVWAAGIKASEILTRLDDLEVNHLNQLVVQQTLQTTRDADIFAFGDCAACPQPGVNKRNVPPRAQAAHQQATLLANTLKRRLQGKPALPYVYHDYGSLISLSRHNTVGNLMSGLRGSLFIKGLIARLIYLMLYKKHQLVLYGFWRVCLMSLADLIKHRIKPKLKLH